MINEISGDQLGEGILSGRGYPGCDRLSGVSEI